MPRLGTLPSLVHFLEVLDERLLTTSWLGRHVK